MRRIAQLNNLRIYVVILHKPRRPIIRLQTPVICHNTPNAEIRDWPQLPWGLLVICHNTPNAEIRDWPQLPWGLLVICHNTPNAEIRDWPQLPWGLLVICSIYGNNW